MQTNKYKIMEYFAMDSVQSPSRVVMPFSVVAEKFYGYALRHALYVAGDHTLAEDITQESFLRLMRIYHRGGGIRSAVKSYLQHLINHVYHDHVKLVRAKKRGKKQETLEDDLYVDERHAEVHLSDRVTRYAKIISRMRPEYAEAIVLRIERVPYRRISEIQQIPMGTVESRLHRARITLRPLLDQ